MNDSPAARDAGFESEAPSLETIRAGTSARRWRLYETARDLLAELDSRIRWDRLYDLDSDTFDRSQREPEELLGWGLYLEEVVPEAIHRLRRAVEEGAGEEERPEPQPEELRDDLYWGTTQLESSLRQALAVLSRAMVDGFTAGGGQLDEEATLARLRDLATPIAEVAGKLRSEVRKLTAFLVAGRDADPGPVELALFPHRRRELEQSLVLNRSLVDTMEGFQGSEVRMPIADVIRLWREGRVLGQAALVEVGLLTSGLAVLLDRSHRQALYVDSYYRLKDWNRHLYQCCEGLSQYLGDEKVEDTLTKEIAAILDADMLAEILGEESLQPFDWHRDLPELVRLLNRRTVARLELRKAERQRLLEIKAAAETALAAGEPVALAADDEHLLLKSAAKIKGQKLVDQLRLPGRLPESLAHLGHVHPLVLEAEEGLKTYLILLYGQIQNRQLHLLAESRLELPLAEKRLVLEELRYRLARFHDSDRFRAFQEVRSLLEESQEVPIETWDGLLQFVVHLQEVLGPRLERVASFDEIQGLSPETMAELRAICQQLGELEEPPAPEAVGRVSQLLQVLGLLVARLDDLSLVTRPPQTVDEIEDFLNMMG